MERRASILTLLGGLVLLAGTAAYLAPHDQHFAPNFAWYWLPAVAALATATALGIASPVAAGGSVALALFLAAFHSWVASLGKGGDMAWLGYLFAMPGAFIGLLVAGWLVTRERSGAVPGLFIGLAATVAGLALNMGVVCSTVMHCYG